MGVAAGDYRQRRLCRHLPHGPRRQRDAPQQRRRHVHRRHARRPAPTIAADGACPRPSSTTIATAGSTCSSATTCTTASTSDLNCQDLTGQRDYCPPNSYRAQPDRLYRNRGQRHLRGRDVAGARRRRRRPGARRLDGRLQRRRLDRHLRGQRRRAEPAVDQPEERHVQGHGAPGRRRGQRRRQRRGQHGHRRRRFRQRRRRGSVRHQLADRR